MTNEVLLRTQLERALLEDGENASSVRHLRAQLDSLLYLKKVAEVEAEEERQQGG